MDDIVSELNWMIQVQTNKEPIVCLGNRGNMKINYIIETFGVLFLKKLANNVSSVKLNGGKELMKKIKT